MRIDRLTVRRFKNLRDLTVDFDESSLSTVVLGRNGAWKSYLLEALVVIFRDLDLGAPPSFPYVIRYECRDQIIDIDADPGRAEGHTQAAVTKVPIGGGPEEARTLTFRQLISADGRP